MLYHLSYTSTQAQDMNPADLKAILEEARSANDRNNITGLLLHRDDAFLQVLEGEQDQVLATFVRIEKDRRHKDVKVLFSEPLEKREFDDWSMAFVNLDGIDINAVQGFSDFMIDNTQPRTYLEEISRAKKTLLLFRAMH